MFNAAGDLFTDRQLVKAMRRLSNDGLGAYTRRQLFYAVSGKRIAKPGLLSRFSKRPKVPRHTTTTMTEAHFDQRLTQWLQRNGMVVGRMLDEQALRSDPNRVAGTPLSPELTPHSFDRVVMVDTAETAVMLVANNVHVDQRCVILSEDGYPEAFRDELVNLLRQNPNLTVAVLHGATINGAGMVARMGAWFPAPSVRFVEVGLRPRQAMSGGLYTERVDARSEPDPTVLADPALARLDTDEREWLAWGLQAPLTALGPQRLTKVLSGVFANIARFDEAAHARGERDSFDDDSGYDDAHGHRPLIFWFDEGGSTGGGDDLSKGFAGFDDDLGFDGGDFDGDG